MPAVRVLLAGGGTAGHVEPALATADALHGVCQQTGIDCEITVLGTAEGLEATLVPARGYHLATVPKVVMPRRIATDLFTVLPRLRSARDRAEQILRERDIDVVVGFGGYAKNRTQRPGLDGWNENRAVPRWPVHSRPSHADA